MRAISVFSFDAGTSTLGCRAASALRKRVNISAIGSLNIRYPLKAVVGFRLSVVGKTHTAADFNRQPLFHHQLALITPGISPFSASWRKHNRHSANLRR